MPKFYFHVQMGELFPDEEGTTLPDERAARGIALEVVAQLVRDAADELWRGDALRVSAEDERRRPLFTLDLSARPARSERRVEAEICAFRSDGRSRGACPN